MSHVKTGVLLLNLGTPLSPSRKDVRAYLKQFLNDPYVIDIPFLFRKLLVDGIILNTRPKKSAEAYEKIWTKAGSPLLLHTRALTEKVQKILQSKEGPSVKMAMRYGAPSIESAVLEFEKEGVEEIVFIPLYPQYSYAASESSIVEFEKILEKRTPRVRKRIVEDFFSDPDFITSLADSIAPVLEREKPDALLLTYHGVPERQLTKIRNRPAVCGTPGCCEKWGDVNLQCYRAQSFETSRRLAAKLGWDPKKVITSFQSRLGRTKWIEPYTDVLLEEMPGQGIRKIVAASPSFTADCLETLEEIQLRYREDFLAAGGEHFTYVPCLNSRDDFAGFIAKIATRP